MSDLEKKFLIRSSGQVLGPFNEKEVIDLIKRGYISSFDEFTEPFSIWFYLENHESFKKALQAVSFQTRLTNLVTKITKSLSKKTAEKTKTDTKTLGENEMAQATEVEVLNQPQPEGYTSSKFTPKSEIENVIRTKVDKVIKRVWLGIIILSLCIGFYVIYSEAILPIQKKRKIRNQLNTTGQDFYKIGQYKKALPYFERAYAENFLTSKEKIALGILYLKENKIERASSIVDEILIFTCREKQ